MRFEKIMGPMKTHRERQTRQQRAMQICRLSFGGISCIIILNGLSDSSILPTGGGQNGSLLGSSLPLPCGFFSATSAGTI